MELIISLLIFSLFLFASLGVIKMISQRDLYLDRLDKYFEKSSGDEKKGIHITRSVMGVVDKASRVVATRSFTSYLQGQLLLAGVPLRAEEYFILRIGLITVLPLLLTLASQNMWLGIITVILAVILPEFYLKLKKDQRLLTLNQQLGDSLIIMANALRAGFGFQQAMDTVRRELPPPISTEFAWTLREMNLGFGLEEALGNLSKRVKSDDLDMVITGIIIQRQVGGNLAEILENISETIRDRAKLKKEIKVLTAQGRLSGIIIGLLPVILIGAMLVINPTYFNTFLYDPRGMFMLGAGIFFEFIGLMVIKKIVSIEL